MTTEALIDRTAFLKRTVDIDLSDRGRSSSAAPECIASAFTVKAARNRAPATTGVARGRHIAPVT